jgi:hypothetical protein
MNTTTTQPTIPINPNQPILPPEMPLDPTNPLIWLLTIAIFLGTTEKNLNAIANLLRAISSFCVVRAKIQRSSGKKQR